MTAALPTLLRKPADFADGPVADRWFADIAETLLTRAELRVGGEVCRLSEVEVYHHGAGLEDPFAHRDPVQLEPGRWYFHKTQGQYRGGSFKGLDLSFGGNGSFAGVLFRGLARPDGTVVDGPSLLVDHLLGMTGYPTVAALDGAIAGDVAWDGRQPVVLSIGAPVERTILRTARVGLSLKRRRPQVNDPALRFLLRRYRYLTDPRRTAKGKLHMVLALHADGRAPADIAATTGSPLATVRRYVADYEAGRNETDPTPYYGREWTTADLCRLHGLVASINCD